MSIEGGGISVSAPSIGLSISGPSFGPLLGGFSTPTMEIGPIMSGPSFSNVFEGPASIGSLESFSQLIPAAPDLGGTIGPIEAVNSTFPIVEPMPMVNIFNEGPAPTSFLENTRPLVPADFLYSPKSMGIIDNPFRPIYSDPGSFYVERPTPLEWFMPEVINFPKPEVYVVGVTKPQIEEEEELEEQLEQVRKTIKKLATKVIEENEVDSAIKVEPSNQLQQAVKQQKMIFRIIEQKKEEGTTPKGKDRVETSQRKMVKDLRALAKRLADVSRAVAQAFNKAKIDEKTGQKIVDGGDTEENIPSEDYASRSGALKEDVDDQIPDGTYVLGKQAIKRIGKTYSKEELQAKVEEVWYENYPVERVKNSQREAASQKQVDDVYMFVFNKPLLKEVLTKKSNT